jgi:putative heme-binding domain-containing protein
MFAALIADAAKSAKDSAAPLAARQDAVRLIGLADFATAKGLLAELLEPRYQQEIQLATVKALSLYRGEPQVADMLLSPWLTYTPALRVEVVEALLSRPERIKTLLNAVAAGTLPAAQISPTRRNLLLAHTDENIRAMAAKILGAEKISPRADVIAQYKPALKLPGDPVRGELAFQRECAQCHRLGNRGHDVGPNLATILHRSAEQLLVNVLDPNREVPPNFIQYTAVLDDGRVATGIIASETPASITLKRAENTQETILRQNIEQLTSTGMSLMPEGIEKKLDPQALADLLAFLLKSK